MLRRIMTLALCAASLSGCSAFPDLDRQISEKKHELERLDGELNAIAKEKFDVTHDVQAEMKYRPVAQWAREVSTSRYLIEARGIDESRHGDLIYKPGTGKAWIEPEHDTILQAAFTPFSLAGTNSGITLSSTLGLHFETRIRLHVGGIGGNVFCYSDAGSPVRMSMDIQPASGPRAAYTISLRQPSDLEVVAVCKLGGLGNLKIREKMTDLAKEVSKGDLELGFESQGKIDYPDRPPENYIITTKDPVLGTKPDGVAYRTNVEIQWQ
jgi:hypothetical protein